MAKRGSVDPVLHKAVFRYRYEDDPSSSNGPDVDAAILLAGRVENWLRDNGRKVHFLNAYMNVSENGRGELVVVLNDPDTALLLKLAVE